jgi:hypothetical protein
MTRIRTYQWAALAALGLLVGGGFATGPAEATCCKATTPHVHVPKPGVPSVSVPVSPGVRSAIENARNAVKGAGPTAPGTKAEKQKKLKEALAALDAYVDLAALLADDPPPSTATANALVAEVLAARAEGLALQLEWEQLYARYSRFSAAYNKGDMTGMSTADMELMGTAGGAWGAMQEMSYQITVVLGGKMDKNKERLANAEAAASAADAWRYANNY